MAIDSVNNDLAVLVPAAVPLGDREPQPATEEIERRKADRSAVSPTIRPSDDASRTLFETRNADPAVDATQVAQKYQQVQEAGRKEVLDQPADQQNPQVITAAQGGGTMAVAATMRPPENPQAQPQAAPTPGQGIGAAARVR